VRDGLREIGELAAAIESYPVKPAVGQWKWVGDAAGTEVRPPRARRGHAFQKAVRRI
jgi:hypothetical protein